LHSVANAIVGLGMLGLNGGGVRLNFGAGGFNRDSRFEPADAGGRVMAALFFIERRSHRLPDFRLDGKAEARRHYADDGYALVVNSDCAADDSRVAAEAPLPQTIADDRRRSRAGLVFFFKKMPATGRIHAEQRKQARHDARAIDPLGALSRIAARECERILYVQRHLLEAAAARAPIDEIRKRKSHRLEPGLQ